MNISPTPKTLPAPYLASFCTELALITGAGISFSDGLLVMRDDETDAFSKEILSSVYSQLSDHIPLHTALQSTGYFPKYMTDMLHIAAETGRSEQVLHHLAEYYNNLHQLRLRIRNAVIYPTVLLFVMLTVIFVLIVKILPLFDSVFAQLGSDMTPVARALLAFGGGIEKYIFVIAIVVILLALGAYLLYRGVMHGNRRAVVLYQRLFASRKLNVSIATARFASVMSLCMHSGMDTDDALAMAQGINTHPILHEKIAQCREMIAQGVPTAEAMLKAQLFSPLYIRMLAVGYKTGNAEVVMKKIADNLHLQVDEDMDSLISRIEPTMVIILSLAVGAILLSVMLPLMGIMTVIG